ncbi:TDP-N-acetylfucosamine:lipid II N-acetylfucosaminyltransferase [Synergistes jonesii]|uniref:TDP-N-acetylfucosamine:lipid II N-acetylfucosaminyltransferase n=1 Tax=Synergistes jonesii TaxID=2754 RepID=UPI003319AA77
MEYKYKYLHICPPSTRMLKGFIMMLNNHFNPSEHYFLCRITSEGGDGFTTLTNNIINWKDLGRGKVRKFLGAVRAMKASKNIVIHGFTFSLKWLTLVYFYRKEIEKKGIWVIWGVDLYNYHRTNGNRFINAIINHMEDKIRESCRTSVAIFPTDIAVFKKKFGGEKTVFCAPLGFSKSSFEEWDAILEKRREIALKYPGAFTRKDRKVSIQVGHNSYPFNNHALALGLLEQYRDQNILITMPMSYGNDYGDRSANYAEDIMHLAYNLFPKDKIRRLAALMPLHKYYEFLGAVDVAILSAPRQNALGNITPLLYMGKKVYLSSDNPLFSFFRSKGFEIHDVKEIATTKYDDFIAPITRSFPNPWIKNFYSVDGNAKRWEVVFGYSDGRYTRDEAYAAMEEFDIEEDAAVRQYLTLDEEKQKEARAEAEIQEREAITKEQENIIAEELLQIYRWLEKRELEDQKKREEKKKRREEWLRKVAESREKNAISSKIRKPYTKVEVYGVTAPGISASGEQYRYLLTVEREPQKR